MQTSIPSSLATDSFVQPPVGTTASIHPVNRAERLHTIDIIRGFALLGILLMNIGLFGLPLMTYFPKLFTLPPDSLDYKFFATISIVFEGTMRALFSMLFGAGILLFTAKKDLQADGYGIADYYYRRLLWLVAFGLLNAFVLLWPGDILYSYGLVGLLLFPFRKLRPTTLFLVAGLCFLISFGKEAWQGMETKQKRVAYLRAIQLEKQHKKLTEDQQKAKTVWLDIEKRTRYDEKATNKTIQNMRSGFGDVFTELLPLNVRLQSAEFYSSTVWDTLIMMFLGMALFRRGFFSNQWKTRSYLISLLAGYSVGLTLGYFAFQDGLAWFRNPGAVIDADGFPFQALYHIRRASTAIGHASLLLLVYRSGVVPWLMKGLGNVGQMAFTNYLMQSLICSLFFYGYGLGYYATLSFYQLYYVVAAVWVFQLIFSAIWLRYFRFGPLEWLWRSLTYWKRQPMRLDQPTGVLA
ncbi:DUF418 domain-containing protein [Spirosoma taeanense]|uniref:DUF418 domain-containing protein n=1 Tax=Spirosoma taeanense TaxID=2735870 RepID=A0A6M5Y952_9BACT|nr:DUF418 domain-containing protein [Spirosoma taeanense]QJW90808.1 DUF418 domain-containing protein [Spirosoma taeanense]